MKTKIYFLTGASWVWKTTIATHLRDTYPDMPILGFDSIWVPSWEEMLAKYWSWEEWQKQTTYKWVEKIIEEYPWQDVVLEWQVNINFILEAVKKYNINNYEIILINCEEIEMLRRLREERNQEELANEDMCNWRNFLEQQAKDYNIEIINTSQLSKEDVVNKFKIVFKK